MAGWETKEFLEVVILDINAEIIGPDGKPSPSEKLEIRSPAFF